MTPDEANQERRDAAIRRGRRIDALEPGQLVNFIHRMAAVEPTAVDRILTEFGTANAPKPRTEPKLHPVRFVANASNLMPAMLAICDVCSWRAVLDESHSLPDLERLVREHSGITS